MSKLKTAIDFPFESHYVEVLGSKMHYVEEGKGHPILFLHGFLSSAYSWRNIIPYLSPLARCIAVDLIGFGKSDRPNISYTIKNQIEYLNHFIDALGLKDITLVMHGWGSVLGFDYAMHHEKNCKGLAFYEAYIQPIDIKNIALPYQEQIFDLQADELSQFIENQMHYVDKIFGQSALFSWDEKIKKRYKEPFEKKEFGKILYELIQELPNGNQSGPIDQVIKSYSKKLTQSNLPKLMLYSIPGFITTIEFIMWAKKHLSHLEVVSLGEGLHFVQENHPKLMGETISAWFQAVEQNGSK